jgi:tetratricopeptide (TPR) repeat protein
MNLRSLRRVVLAGVLLLATASAVNAEPVSPREMWPQATAATDTGDYKGGEKRLSDLLETARALGIRRFPLFAQSAMALARQAYAQNNREIAVWAQTAAQKLDPYSPDVAFSAADMERGRSNWMTSLGHVMRGIGRVSGDYSASTVAQNDMLVVICLALLSTTALFAFALFLRYRRSAAHDFRELLGRRFSPGVSTVLAYALLLLPLFLWFGPMWLALFWMALFFGYATKVERGLTIALLLICAVLPIATAWGAYRVAGVDSPVVRAAVASDDRSYSPETVRRLRELVEVIPDNPKLQLLLGNLLVQEGDEQQASVHYRRAIQLSDTLAGAHVNLGNLHFLDNDFVAATTEYERAQSLDPRMTIAYYNQSVAAGELYKYDQQGAKLAEAKKYDRGYVDRLVANPPAQKVVRYNLPIDDAWTLAESIAKKKGSRDVFGNFASFDLVRSALNTLTFGSLLALVAGVVTYLLRRTAGFAGSCIKCGRTFCHRCKSSRESAIYCTQCIHIYLKRDGVSIDTKRAKLEEVQEYQQGTLSMRKWLSAFVPGSGHLLDGATIRGVIIVILFMLFFCTALLLGRLAPIANPAETVRLFMRIIAIAAAVIVWLVFTIPVLRQKSNNV